MNDPSLVKSAIHEAGFPLLVSHPAPPSTATQRPSSSVCTAVIPAFRQRLISNCTARLPSLRTSRPNSSLDCHSTSPFGDTNGNRPALSVGSTTVVPDGYSEYAYWARSPCEVWTTPR